MISPDRRRVVESRVERARKKGERFCSTSVHMAELWRGSVEDKK